MKYRRYRNSGRNEFCRQRVKYEPLEKQSPLEKTVSSLDLMRGFGRGRAYGPMQGYARRYGHNLSEYFMSNNQDDGNRRGSGRRQGRRGNRQGKGSGRGNGQKKRDGSCRRPNKNSDSN